MKDTNVFINKNLTLVRNQKKELEIDLQPDDFLKDYEKTPSYKLMFESKGKLQAQRRTQWASLIQLFMVPDHAIKVKEDLDDTLDSCGAVFIGKKHPDVLFPWLGNETVHAVFNPLLQGLSIDIQC